MNICKIYIFFRSKKCSKCYLLCPTTTYFSCCFKNPVTVSCNKVYYENKWRHWNYTLSTHKHEALIFSSRKLSKCRLFWLEGLLMEIKFFSRKPDHSEPKITIKRRSTRNICESEVDKTKERKLWNVKHFSEEEGLGEI